MCIIVSKYLNFILIFIFVTFLLSLLNFYYLLIVYNTFYLVYKFINTRIYMITPNTGDQETSTINPPDTELSIENNSHNVDGMFNKDDFIIFLIHL